MAQRSWRVLYAVAAAVVVVTALALVNSVPAHSATAPIPGLAAWYTFDGHSGDMSGNEHHGTVGDGTLVADRFGRRNAALYFDGKNDFATFPVNINPEPMPQLTMTIWIMPDGAQTESAHIVSHDSGGYDRSIVMSDEKNERRWVAYTGTGKRLESKPRVLSNTWVFLAVVYDEREGSVRFWVDGESYVSPGKLGSGFLNLRAAINVSTMRFFRGTIDDLRIYNRALSLAEINQIRSE